MASRQLTKQGTQPVRKSFLCSCCGKEYTAQATNFQKCGSELYKGNGGYITVCNQCVEDLFAQYNYDLCDESEAAKMLCSKLDIYWDPASFSPTKARDEKSSIAMYLIQLQRLGFYTRSFSDSEKERKMMRIAEGRTEEGDFIVTPEMRNFWGDGFTAKQYSELETIYNRWKGERVLNDSDEVGLYRSISITDWQIMNAARTGGKTEQLTQALNSLLGKTRITKISNSANDIQPIGPKIRDWETEQPIPEPSEEFKDVDGIVRYITTWFNSFRPNIQQCVFA